MTEKNTEKLEKWAERKLADLGVDEVFAPYIVGMVDPSQNVDEVHASIHEVLMGWLPVESQSQAHDFVRELIHFEAHPQDIPEETPTAAAVAAAPAWNEYLDFKTSCETNPHMSPNARSYIPMSTSPSFDSMTAVALPPPATTTAKRNVAVDPYSEPSPASLEDKYDDGEIATEDMNEDQFVWSVAHDLIDQLNYRFPEAHPASLLEILKTIGMDVNKAAGVVKSILEKEQSGMTQVCRHYLQGECRRADCMFLHETHKVTCRFWLRGACTQSENCIFLHGIALDAEEVQCMSDSEEEIDDTPPDLASEDKFPALGGSSTPKTEAVPASAGRSLSSFSLDFARALTMEPAAEDSHHGKLSNRSQVSRISKLDKKHFGNKWVSTGDSVKVQYKTLRADASTLARARNECFMNATQAYRSGNKARATELSRKGRQYNAKMKELHLLAATEIFKNRNPPNQLYREQLMDLHGLHVAEAIEFLAEMLPQLADDGLQAIRIVTGSGHHSAGSSGKARLRPAVERFLNSEGYHYSEIPDQRGFIGMLLVHVAW